MTPYDTGFIAAGDGHRLYYERCGNRSGIPVLFLHGGPGSGIVDSHKRAFDFKKFNVLFFDQRGAGRSTPFATVKANTTPHLVADINLLLNHFGLKRVVVFGGSWGSTLGLVYAIRHPERVLGLILRGIFLADSASMKHYLGGGVATYAPAEWERFISQVPPRSRNNLIEYYYRKMTRGPTRERKRFAFEWAVFELSLLALETSLQDVEQRLRSYSFESLSILKCHYLRSGCFIPRNFILRNAEKIARIPTSIVHGRYDLICPPEQAYRLHKKLPASRLLIVNAGHAATEPEILSALRSELALLEKRLRGKFRSSKQTRS